MYDNQIKKGIIMTSIILQSVCIVAWTFVMTSTTARYNRQTKDMRDKCRWFYFEYVLMYIALMIQMVGVLVSDIEKYYTSVCI